ncbi:putative aspartic-type endopeptidase [Lachnellula subtilissima]|uniref:Putative aspartic-type endopeptidase n=1 Tax=Lachnellula subtilissima TaxID=602034 RepID=A0A8H8U8Y6_9HELO|nr:putative aspartic-type endopeptidase [Lachnellula subtilissima]
MLRFILVCAFASISSSYNVPDHKPTIEDTFTIPGTLFANKHAPTNGSGVLQLQVKVHDVHLEKLTSRERRKRQSSDPLVNIISGYTIDISLGSPSQEVTVIMDTGSSELWVDPDCTNSYSPSECASFGRYIPSHSSTSRDLGTKFAIQYGIGSVNGEYFTDNLIMGGSLNGGAARLNAQQFGVANTSMYTPLGIMGVGFGYQLDTNYYNIIDQLYVQGVTNSRAFSLDLASIDVSQGSIIFGGIDTMKYIGALEKRPIIPYRRAPDRYPRYWIYMTSVGVTPPGASPSAPVTGSGYNQAIFPDSGSTLSQLPTALVNALLSYFPDAVSQGSGAYTVPCSYRNQAGTIDFGFGNTTIHVSYHEWFWFDGQSCWFGAQATQSTFLLGVVYDQDNANVLLAQAANCGINVLAIGTGVNAVPSVTGGCTASSRSDFTKATTSSSNFSIMTTSSKISSSSSIPGNLQG